MVLRCEQSCPTLRACRSALGPCLTRGTARLTGSVQAAGQGGAARSTVGMQVVREMMQIRGADVVRERLREAHDAAGLFRTWAQ